MERRTGEASCVTPLKGEGGIRSVLDEYVHMLVESQGLMDKPLEEQTLGISSTQRRRL